MKTAYIIDYSNFEYRFKNARVANDLQHIDGMGNVDLSVIYGFIQSIRAIKADEIFIALDGTPKRALELLPSYKGNRDHENPDRLYPSTLTVLKCISHEARQIGKPLHVCCYPFTEADSVISALIPNLLGQYEFPTYDNFKTCAMNLPKDDTRLAPYCISICNFLSNYKYGWNGSSESRAFDRIIIGSMDSDLYQLRKYKGVCFDRSTTGKDIAPDNETPAAVQHLPFYYIRLYKSLFGDKSDCIPASAPTSYAADLRRFLTSDAATPEIIDHLEYDLDYAGRVEPMHDYKAIGAPDLLTYMAENKEARDAYGRNLHIVRLKEFIAPYELYFPDNLCFEVYNSIFNE